MNQNSLEQTDSPDHKTYKLQPLRQGSFLLKSTALLFLERAQNLINSKLNKEKRTRYERTFRRLIESLHDPIIIVNNKGIIESVNEKCKKMLGYENTELIGQPTEILLPKRYHKKHVAIRNELISDSLVKLLPNTLFESVVKLKNSIEIPVCISISPLEAEGGLLFTACIRDVSIQKRITDLTPFLAQFTKIIPEVFDYQTRLQRMTDLSVPFLADWAFIAAPDRNKIIIKTLTQHDPNEKPRILEILNDFWLQNEEPPFTLASVIKQGRTFFVEQCEPRPNESWLSDNEYALFQRLNVKSFITLPLIARDFNLGTITLVIANTRRRFFKKDVTYLEAIAGRIALAADNSRLYSDATKAIAARESIIAMVSHDLKNPIAAIQLGTQLLLDQFDSEQTTYTSSNKNKTLLECIDRQAKFANSLINDLLDFSKIQSGTFGIECTLTKVASLVDYAIELMIPLADKKNIQIQKTIEPGIDYVYCDQNRILQVISNIVSNAIKFSKINDVIKIEVKCLFDDLQFCISDNGIGIASEQLGFVFDRFWQNRETSNLGAGLGLAIAKGIITTHKGKIWATSEVNKGSLFYFTIPTSDSQISQLEEITRPQPEKIAGVPAPQANSSPQVLAENRNKNLHILLVDDSLEMLTIMGILLRKNGIEVTEASSVDQAMEKLSVIKPDVIVSDIEMPNTNGYDLLKRVHQFTKETGGHIPIAALTAHYSKHECEKIEAAGFDLRLQKPINAKTLIAALQKLNLGPATLNDCP